MLSLRRDIRSLQGRHHRVHHSGLNRRFDVHHSERKKVRLLLGHFRSFLEVRLLEVDSPVVRVDLDAVKIRVLEQVRKNHEGDQNVELKNGMKVSE